MLSIVQELEKNTQAYWRLSQVWNAKSEEQIPTGDAINLCNSLRFGMNAARPVCKLSASLLNEIIQGAGTIVEVSSVRYLTSDE